MNVDVITLIQMEAQMTGKLVSAFCLALLASQLHAQTKTNEDPVVEYSAESELLEQDASIGWVYGSYYGAQPKYPILDKDGSVHPASCNPHINFCQTELSRGKLKTILPHLKNLRPDAPATHVALYLPKKLYDDKTLVKQLKKQLPRCRVYFEHHKANTHNVPINRAKN